MTTLELLQKAREARVALISADSERKNAALNAMAQALLDHSDDILKANALDMAAAVGKISDPARSFCKQLICMPRSSAAV